MPQLQNTIPVAAAPSKKLLRVVIRSLPNDRSIGTPAHSQMFFRYIANVEGIKQSYPARIAAGRPDT
jgi:hypothetical protein